MDNKLLESLSDDQIAEARGTYKDVPSIITLLDGIMAIRESDRDKAQEALVAEAEIAKVSALRDRIFIKATDKMLGVLPEYSPDWRKDTATQAINIRTVEVDDFHQEEVEVEVNGVLEMRHPKKLIRTVIIGIAVTQAKTASTTTASKRAINIFKHNPTGADEGFGEFANYQAFADSKGINTGQDSAKRALERDGYYGVATTT